MDDFGEQTSEGTLGWDPVQDPSHATLHVSGIRFCPKDPYRNLQENHTAESG